MGVLHNTGQLFMTFDVGAYSIFFFFLDFLYFGVEELVWAFDWFNHQKWKKLNENVYKDGTNFNLINSGKK